MSNEPTSTVRARRLRERRARGIAMVTPVEVGEGGIELLVGNGLRKQHQITDRQENTTVFLGRTPNVYLSCNSYKLGFQPTPLLKSIWKPINKS